MKKRLLSLTLIAAMLFLTCRTSALSASAEVKYIPLPTDHSKEFYATQWESIETYNKLLESFSADAGVCAASEDEPEDEQYPDYFGGAYINDLGGLVVLTTDMSNPVVNSLKSAADGGITVSPCAVSLNELMETIDLISNQRDLLAEQGVEIVMLRDDILSGKVVVSVTDLTAEKERIIQSISGCDYLEFQDGGAGCSENATIKAGAYITNIDLKSTDNSATVGFAAVKSSGARGIVTVGHVAPARDNRISYNKELIGVVRGVSFHNGMTADAAFILTDSDVTLVAEVVNGYRIVSGNTSQLPIKTVVSMYGNESGLTSGTNISYKATGQLSKSGYWFKEFATATYSSQNGDSGGPVLVYNGASHYSLAGMHCASLPDKSFFTPYKNIVEVLDVTCLTYYG